MKPLYFLICILLVSCEVSTSDSSEESDLEPVEEKNNWLEDIEDLGKKAWKEGEKYTEKLKQIEINGFSVDDDIKLGKQLDEELKSSSEYNLLSRNSNPQLYSYLEGIRNTILENGEFRYRDKFEWKLTVIDDDETVNAFCAPGGYIYIYTGILKYLDNEAELAGVLAHEMGHAERRHGTRQMTKSLGIKAILDFLTGGSESSYYKEVINGLISLRYSRHYEREADECSVKYLCSSEYKSDGAAGFFEKILKEEGERSSELLSTHPDPAERISNFHASRKKMKCTGDENYTDRYLKMKKSL
ncbi:MAG: M48 family metalloprotease [Cryomorphaceae bacterium]|jgi:predicted Zn-dependent protease|nr:M48 family metalloprotease [Cryomorphaceae bacterium]